MNAGSIGVGPPKIAAMSAEMTNGDAGSRPQNAVVGPTSGGMSETVKSPSNGSHVISNARITAARSAWRTVLVRGARSVATNSAADSRIASAPAFSGMSWSAASAIESSNGSLFAIDRRSWSY